MRFGVVESFSNEGNEKFGLIKPDKGEGGIFFRLNQGRKLKTVNGGIVFDSIKTDMIPKTGDRVVFLSIKKNERLFASTWGFEEEFYKINGQMKHRVRVVHGCWMDRSVAQREFIVWEGYDTNEINEKFPKPEKNRNAVNDPLYPCYKHENGFMLETFFELKNEDGIWIKSKDPR